MTYSILISSKHLQSALGALALLAVLLALFFPRLGRRRFRLIERKLQRLSRHRWKAVAFAAGFPLLIRVLLLPLFPVPLPRVHDEFSYLLQADTFAHGRLANPPPPEWQHFETEYVLLQPTYASQYQPAQGLLLGAAQKLTGHPWWGVWAGIGLMSGSLCWALSWFFPPAWALFGSLAISLQCGIFGFWMNSYFGGGVAAAGGALVAGSLFRFRRDRPFGRHAASGAICGLGLIFLFASRPAEALLWTLVAGVLIAGRWRKNRPGSLTKFAAPFTAVFLAGAVFLALYNFHVTGNVLETPYAHARQLYGTPQSYWWQPAVIVTKFSNPQLRDNYLNQLDYWKRRSSPAAMWESTWRRLRDFWRFFVGPFLTPALFFFGALRRDRKMRPWLLVMVPFIAEHATYHAWYPQQSASETVLIAMVLVQGWRHLRVWQRQRGHGLAMSETLMTGFAAGILLISMGRAAESHLPARVRDIWASLVPSANMRDHVVAQLQRLPGKHLVFVHYGPKHSYTDEWVFNAADIPGSRLVFARLIDPASDLALMKDLGKRSVWVADPDTGTLSRISAGCIP